MRRRQNHWKHNRNRNQHQQTEGPERSNQLNQEFTVERENQKLNPTPKRQEHRERSTEAQTKDPEGMGEDRREQLSCDGHFKSAESSSDCSLLIILDVFFFCFFWFFDPINWN